jgi:hypothetical protein
MSIKYINIFQSKTLQKLPKLFFFGLKVNHLATLVSEEEEKKKLVVSTFQLAVAPVLKVGLKMDEAVRVTGRVCEKNSPKLLPKPFFLKINMYKTWRGDS